MAERNKKTASGKKRGTTKKTTTSGKKNSGKRNEKQSQGPDLLTIVVVMVAIVLVIVLISKYSKEKDGTETGNPTGSVTVTGTGTPEDTGVPEAPTTTQEPEATKAVTEPVKPTATPTPIPESTPEPILSEAEARQIAEKIVRMENYSMELLDDHLMIEGEEYYAFCVNDEHGESMSPLLIVEKKKGALLCYDMSGVVASIESFPLDNTEVKTEPAGVLTVESAKAILAGYTGERLGLAKEVSNYEMTADEWTTMANGTECYGINLFEDVDGRQRLRGIFYVAVDGSAVYSKDDITGEFIKR